ncbi:hypothetical protein DAPPUDRAFT_251945 [Daphnia pulex]|uniref:Uncharacterized protein n=1 Tax=Daphnia pulex TaxID=6669 RepID=E9H1A5_DAPPU|nr:hypothetical protein DAPPUDRAFT_251945 [Daphnia pulex]|eukprot:EFX74409.1 hypothetical protein DAPPUDRAFT_251945 [Daphnia pulex]
MISDELLSKEKRIGESFGRKRKKENDRGKPFKEWELPPQLQLDSRTFSRFDSRRRSTTQSFIRLLHQYTFEYQPAASPYVLTQENDALADELEMMGLPGLASSSSYQHQQQVDYGGVGAMVVAQPAEDVISDLISSSYDLIGLLRDLQRSKRQREDHAQQLIHDLQRSQWLLDKEKELGVQREREAAEAYEKERQANVRLQLSETLLKKKSEEHRQLAHESQLKENQWLHALRRRDQENHRLHQQLLKFLHSKSTGGGGGTGMVQVEMRGSLGAPARTSSSDSTRLRKQWDRTATADDAKKLVEAKWKMAFNSLEKDHGLLRADYFQLVEMVGRFLTNCSTQLTMSRTRSADTRPFSNVTEWIQLPVVLMRDRLEQVFQLVETGLVSTTFPVPNQQDEIITDRQQQPSFDSLEIDYVMPAIIGQPLLEPETVTITATAHQQQLLLPALLENQKVATNNCISPPSIIKDEVVGAGVTTSRTSSSSAISTATTKSAAAAQQRPLKMVKSIVQQQNNSTTSTTGRQFDGGLATDRPHSSIVFRNNNAGRTTINLSDESSSQVVVNQVDWNETDSSPPAAAAVYRQKSYSLLMPGRQQSTSGTSCPIIGFKENDDGLLLDEMMAITLDTPCPSASNSRSGSCSSTSSISSCKSQQQQESSGIDPCADGGIDEQLLRTCSDAASLVGRDNGSRISAAGPSALKSGTAASTSLNLNRRTITARVRFVQHQQPTSTAAAGGAHHHPGDPVDLQCRLITPPPPI